MRRRVPTWLQLAAVAVAGLASIATPPPRYESTREFPIWHIVSGRTRESGGVRATLHVARSGKEGVSFTLELERRAEGDARVRIHEAWLRVGERAFELGALPGEVVLAGRGGRFLFHLPFPFDNEALWNQGRRAGSLELRLQVDGALQPAWRLPLAHYRLSPHRVRDRWARERRCDEPRDTARQRTFGGVQAWALLEPRPDLKGLSLVLHLRRLVSGSSRVEVVEARGAEERAQPVAVGPEGALLLQHFPKATDGVQIALAVDGAPQPLWSLACPERRRR